MVNDDRGLPRPWVPGDEITIDAEPTVPVNGKPHLVKIDGKWAIVVGPGGAWHSIASMALKHAKKLNEISQ